MMVRIKPPVDIAPTFPALEYPKRNLFAQFFHFHLVSSHPKIMENTALYGLAILPKNQNT